MRNLITAQEVIDLAFAENSNMMAESISDTAIRIAEIKYIRPAFGAMYPLLTDKYADFTNDYVKPALAYFVKCEIVSSIAIDMSNSGVAVANPQYQSAATDKQRQRLYDSEMSKAKTLLDFALEYIATHSEEFPDFNGEAPKKHHRVGGILLGGGTSRNQSASIAGEAFKNEFERLSKDVAGKVDKVEGKGLSTNDFTDEYKKKVEEFSGGGSITIDKELSGTSDNAIANSAVTKAINAMPTKKGYYPDMSVGMADNLVGRGDVQDAHINFRPSAGADNITDGAARIEKIKGNSVVWNQGYPSKKVVIDIDNSSGTSVKVVYLKADSLFYAKANSYYYCAVANCKFNHSSTIIYNGYLVSQVVDLKDKPSILYSNADRTSVISLYAQVDAGVIEHIECEPIVVNLTQMFGAGNEPTTVDEYLQRKPMNIEDEFAYNAGTLVDMKADSLISTSDNAYDYTKGYARVMGGYKYDITANAGATLVVSFYADGEDDNEEREIAPDSEGKYTFPANGICYVNGDSILDSDICVCLNHSYDKPHPAYQQDVKDLSFISEAFPEGMRSAGSAFDEIRFNPTTQKWEAVKRIGEVDLGSLEWGYESTSDYSCFVSKSLVDANENMICSLYSTINKTASLKNMPDKSLKSHSSLLGYICIVDKAYSNAKTFRQEMQGVKLYYELAEPIVVELDYPTAETNMDYLVWDFGTEEAVVPNNVPSAPFRADINYEPNAVDDLRWAVAEIRNLKAQIAQMSASVTNLSE